MVYGQLSYEQIYNRTRAKGPRGTLQASDGDKCLMKTLANITSLGVLSAPYFVGNGAGLVSLTVPTLQSVINRGNTFSDNTLIASNISVGNLFTNGLYVLNNVLVSNHIQASYFYGDGSQLTNLSVPTLQSVVDHGNTVTGNTVQLSSLVTPVGSLTGLGTLVPSHTLDVGSNFYVTDTGDARIENLTTNGTYNGISNLNPIHTLDVGSNFFVTDTGGITCVLNTSDNDDIYPVSFVDTNVNDSSPILFNDNIGIKPNKGILNIKGYGASIDLADRTYNSNVWHHHVNSFGSDISQYFVYYQPNGKSFMSFSSDGRAAFASMNNNQEYIPSTPSTIEFGSNVAMYDLSPSGYVLKVTGNTYSDGLLTTGTTNSGIANTSPIHTLDVGSNLYVSETGSNVLTVLGNIFATGNLYASKLFGDGSGLTGIQTSTPSLQSVINVGNVVTGNTVQLSNLVTTGMFTGISNLLPVHTLDVGSNLYISDTSVSGNVLYVKGNIFTNGAFQMSTLQSNGVIYVNSSNILSTDYNSFRYDPTLHILRVDDVGGGDFRLVTGGGIFKQTTIKGQAIYTEPNPGNQIHFHLADNGVVTKMPCIGLALRDYNNNDTGYIVTHGPIAGLSITDVMVESLSPGAFGDIGKIVYVSNVAGKLTITRPTSATNLVQNLGIILKVTGQTFDMQIIGTGRYEDAPNFIQAAQANVYQYVSIGGQLNKSANLYVNGLTSTSNIVVRNTDGAYSIASNTITLNQFGTTYKTFNVYNPPTQIKNIDFTNVIDGGQSILNIRGATDIFLNLSNTTGSSTYTKTSLSSNVVLTSGQRCIVKCITLDSNTFVDFTVYN